MSKPLWLCWVVEGLQDNEVALVTLVHHAYTDGSGAARLLHRIYSLSQNAAEPEMQMAWVLKDPGRLSLLTSMPSRPAAHLDDQPAQDPAGQQPMSAP